MTVLDQNRAGHRYQPAPSGPTRNKKPMNLGTPFSYFAALLILIATVAPLLFTFMNGFRTNAQINKNPMGLPSPWTFSNYSDVLSRPEFWRYLWNSVLISTVATTAVVVLGSMAAFALSRYQFKLRESFYSLFVAGLLFPVAAAALPLFLLLREMNMQESWLGVALPSAAFSLPVTIVILRPFMAAIPGELEDAAVVDGTTRLGFFWRIMLPLSRPALTTVAILAFVTSWNQYLLPMLVFNNADNYTLPLGVATFQTQYSQDLARMLAFTGISMLPALLFFIFAERKIVGGLSGSIKG